MRERYAGSEGFVQRHCNSRRCKVVRGCQRFLSGLWFFLFASIVFPNTQSFAQQSFAFPVLLEFYVNSAFHRSDFLIRPSSPVALDFVCIGFPRDRCSDLGEHVAKYVPASGINFIETVSDIHSQLSVVIYGDKKLRADTSFIGSGFEGLQSAVYDDGSCAVYQFLDRYLVRRAVILAVTEMTEREVLACVVNELARGAGLSFKERFADYRTTLHAMSDAEFDERMMYFSRLLKIHFDERLSPGFSMMKTAEVLSGE